MHPKYTALTPDLYGYLIQNRSGAGDPILQALRRETEALGDVSRMLISEEQGSFFTLLVAALGVQSAIEIGTFTGYSSICIARGLSAHGRLICCDISKEWTSIARKYWIQAGVERKIDLRLGTAGDTLKKLKTDATFDFAFIDADKTGYETYCEMILPRMKTNGLMVFDNMLWGGRLGSTQIDQADGRAIDALNRKLTHDPRVESVLLPISDGLLVCRKK